MAVRLLPLVLFLAAALGAALAQGAVRGCRARASDRDDLRRRAGDADAVFEAKLVTRSRRPPKGPYNVTLQVQDVLKGDVKRLEQIRLELGIHCRLNVRLIVFANRDGHVYKALGDPVPRTLDNLQRVKEVLCGPFKLFGMKPTIPPVTEGKKIKLVCRIKVEANRKQKPVYEWFKNNISLVSKDRKLKIRHKSFKSVLVVHKARAEDAGEYKCQVSMACSGVKEMKTKVSVSSREPPPRPPPPQVWHGSTIPYYGVPCELDSFCLNGGTCSFIQAMGEMSCQCAEGFVGYRCENKDVTSTGSTYGHRLLSCKLGVSISYNC